MARKSAVNAVELSTYIAIKELQGHTPIGVGTGIDWTQAAALLKSADGRLELAQTITDYFGDLKDAANNPYGVYEKSTRPGHIPGALPSMPDINVNFYGPVVDAGILAMFQTIDKTQSKNPTHQIANVSAQAVVFEQREEGQPARVRNVTGGTPFSVQSVSWHGAVGIDDDAKRFDEYSIFEQNVQRVPVIWDAKMAAVHHALFAALGAGVNETWSTDLITTLNNAGAQILEDCGEIYSLPDNPTLMLYYNHRNWVDVQQAMASNFTLPNNNNSAKALQWNIIPIKSRRPAVNEFYLGLPGHDMVSVIWDYLYSEYGRDFSRGVDSFVYRARRNAAIGNSQQVRRINKP